MRSDFSDKDDFYQKHLRPFPQERPAAFAAWPPEVTRLISMILRRGTRQIDCQAAGLYLLDERTSFLKLCGSWGTLKNSSEHPIRPLSSATADLEALLGNAVVLNEPFLREKWNAPEQYETSLCIPVADDQTLLGTIWFFSDKKRDFTSDQLEKLELVAAKVALEIKRASLIKNRPDIESHQEQTAGKSAAFQPKSPAGDQTEWDTLKESEELLDLLRKRVEKSGTCKTMMLFVAKDR
ncbi:MAG: GAF domain-containing protein [Thermoguttaceae bacterium]|nr:GAF domain-containing protein [Thermoguttaceae bacterium]